MKIQITYGKRYLKTKKSNNPLKFWIMAENFIKGFDKCPSWEKNSMSSI